VPKMRVDQLGLGVRPSTIAGTRIRGANGYAGSEPPMNDKPIKVCVLLGCLGSIYHNSHPTHHSLLHTIKYIPGRKVLTGTVNVYTVFYGNWTKTDRNITNEFVSELGKTSWWNINRKYYYQASKSATKTYVSSSLKWAKEARNANYTLGKSLTGNDIPMIIQEQIDVGVLPVDTKGMYMVLLAKDVAESIRPEFGTASICTNYCGYHVSWLLPEKYGVPRKRIFYGVQGDTERCLGSW
jgi:hypothetical protein